MLETDIIGEMPNGITIAVLIIPALWTETAKKLLAGKPISGEIAIDVAEESLAGSKTLSGNAYKVQIAKTLLKRA